MQRLAHETWDDVRAAGRRSAGLEDLHLTLSRLLNQQHTVFEESWQRLTLAQRAVLRAIVLESGREVLSADVRTRHRLPGASSVQSALAALVRQDIVMKEQGRYVGLVDAADPIELDVVTHLQAEDTLTTVPVAVEHDGMPFFDMQTSVRVELRGDRQPRPSQRARLRGCAGRTEHHEQRGENRPLHPGRPAHYVFMPQPLR